MSDISIWKRLCRWLRTWRKYEEVVADWEPLEYKTGWRIVCPKCKLGQACDASNEPVTCKNCKYTWNG